MQNWGGVVLAILVAFPVSAQTKLKFSVAGFEQDLTDLSAQSAEYKKVDGSGSLYAIIKVTSTNPDDDLREYNFNFGSLKHIVDDQHDGELWLYVQRNAKTVTITRKGYATVTRYDLRTSIQAGKNYVMQLSAAQRPVYKQMVKFSINPAKAKAVVMVKSAKEGAEEELFGITDGNTGEVAKSLELGSYTYRVIASGRYTVEGRLSLTDRSSILNEKVNLRAKSKSSVGNDSSLVKFTVAPVGTNAVLLVNRDDDSSQEFFGFADARTGIAQKHLAPGKYTYMIISDEYESAEGTFVVQARQRGASEQGVTLKPNFSTITLKVAADADIYIDNAKKGTRTWTGKLKAGTYYVECRQTNMKNSAQFIKVEKNASRTIQLDSPTSITGTLSVSSNPLGATVTIDGIEWGETPQNIDIPIGHHTVVFTKPNYRSDTVQVDIAENLTTDLSRTLVNSAKITFNSSPKGASLSIDGKSVGTTPYTQEMESGDYLIRLTARRHRTYEQRVHLDSSNPTLDVKLSQQYIRPTTIYLQGGGIVGARTGIGASLGAYIHNFNAEAFFSVVLDTGEIYLVNNRPGDASRHELKPLCFGGRIGYGIMTGKRCRITPQIGLMEVLMTNHPYTYSLSLTAGMRAEFAFSSYFGMSASGEWSFAVNKKETFKRLSEVSSKVNGWANGGNLFVGIYFSL